MKESEEKVSTRMSSTG